MRQSKEFFEAGLDISYSLSSQDSHLPFKKQESESKNMKTVKMLMAATMLVFAAQYAQSQINVTENFSSNPIGGGNWNFAIGNNSNSQYIWANTAPAFTGDSNGSLTVQANSTLPTVYFERPIGGVLTKNTSFSLSSIYSINNTSGNGFLQYAFGLVNSTTTTNVNRTLSGTYDSIEWNYYPYDNGWGSGPSLQQGAFASNPAPFANSFFIFGPSVDVTLADNQLYKSVIDYDSSTKILSMDTFSVAGDGSLNLFFSSPDVNLTTATGFNVDSLSIMTYTTDGFGAALNGQMTFQQISVTTPVPEPRAYILMFLGAGLFFIIYRSKRKLVVSKC